MRVLWLCAGLTLALVAPLRADEPKSFQVPYRLSKTQHILVRAKINGKGPFNFILDTGAPALFVATKVAKKVGLEPDKTGWAAFDKLEIEGGVPVAKIKGRVEDPFQLEGMNGLGLAGVELHGMIGYNLLARYRLEIDFTRDKMTWTELDFDPPAPKGLEGAKARQTQLRVLAAQTVTSLATPNLASGMTQFLTLKRLQDASALEAKGGLPELDALGAGLKLLGGLIGRRAKPEIVARGFLGLEVAETDGRVTVNSVLEKGPADRAGVKAGDRIASVDGRRVADSTGLLRLAAQLTAGKEVTLTIVRGDKRQDISVKAGEGL